MVSKQTDVTNWCMKVTETFSTLEIRGFISSLTSVDKKIWNMDKTGNEIIMNNNNDTSQL